MAKARAKALEVRKATGCEPRRAAHLVKARERSLEVRRALAVLIQLHLPYDFVALLTEGRLEQEVALRREQYRRLVALVDAFEAQNPEAVEKLPWLEAREAWKAAGRPEPEWYELLSLFDSKLASRSIRAASTNLLWRDLTESACRRGGRRRPR